MANENIYFGLTHFSYGQSNSNSDSDSDLISEASSETKELNYRTVFTEPFSMSNLMSVFKGPSQDKRTISSFEMHNLVDVKHLLGIIQAGTEETKSDVVNITVYLGDQWLRMSDMEGIDFAISGLGTAICWYYPKELTLRMKPQMNEEDEPDEVDYTSSSFGGNFLRRYIHAAGILRGDLESFTFSLTKSFCDRESNTFRNFIEVLKVKKLTLEQDGEKDGSLFGCLFNTRYYFGSYKCITHLTIKNARLDGTSCLHLRDLISGGNVEDFCLDGCTPDPENNHVLHWKNLFSKGVSKSKTIKRLRLLNMSLCRCSPEMQLKESEELTNELFSLFRRNTTIEILLLTGWNIDLEDHQWLKLFMSFKASKRLMEPIDFTDAVSEPPSYFFTDASKYLRKN
jgi:hypothetical protein